MIQTTVLNDLTTILFVLILATTGLIITVRTLSSLLTIYSVQSLLIATVAIVLYVESRSGVLILLAILTVASKGLLVPYVMRRVQKAMNMTRDVEFRYLTSIGSILVGSSMVFLVHRSFAPLLTQLSFGRLFSFGAVIGVSMALMGMMVIFTRRRVVTKTLGYLTMENGVLLFSLLIAELPFIIELLIVVDLIMLIVLATVLAFGIDSSVDEFHAKLNSFTLWFKD